jgi:hypothetical protein
MGAVMTDPLQGMTQAKWDSLSPAQRDALRDNSGLSKDLIGLEGWRVEVVTCYEETRRFIVGRSTGWRPCHLEVKTRASHGGTAAEQKYRWVRKLYKVR